ncbi:MAG: hypothetical protein RLZZ323_167 [Bacteroidota bacterium]|jgi:hypothetical protein
MYKFDLKDGKFFSYNNRTISSDQPWSLTDVSENSLLRLVAWNIFKSREKPKLSFTYKIIRFLTHFKWADKYFTSGKGRINDSKFFVDEIVYHLTKLTSLTYLSSSELRELLISSIRVYFKDGWDAGTPILEEDLRRCVNLQEFYSNELEINFDFAENLKNLRVVNLYVNDTNNKYGDYKGARYKYKTGTVIREVVNVEKLKSCVVLHLVDSHVKEFNKIPDNIWSLSLRNSNFENLNDLTHLKNLEYLDISYTFITSTNGLSQLENLRILNLCCIKLNGENEKTKIYQEILNLENLYIVIIDTENLNAFFGKNIINSKLKNKIIEVPNKYNIGDISTFELVEMLKIKERITIQNDLASFDFWNAPMGETREDKSYEVKIDYEKIKNQLHQKLIK